MWNAISAVMNGFNDFLWGWFMIILLLGTHIFSQFAQNLYREKLLRQSNFR